MTREERDAEIQRSLREYADNKEAIACLRQRLRRIYHALSALDFGVDDARIAGGIGAALGYLQDTQHDPECPVLNDLQSYVRLEHAQKQLAAFLRPTCYGRLIGEE